MKETEESQIHKENMTLEMKGGIPCNENKNSNKKQRANVSMTDVKCDNLEEEILNHVANSKATFKSQQKGEPELTYEEKRAIAEQLLKNNHCSFLSKFGHYLKVEYLNYFSSSEDYETVYHVNRLQRYFNNSMRRIDVRNKRYEALKALIKKGEYFSECEMMKRNPLLYEHLVGQYLTEEEKKARDTIDTSNVNYVDVLLETIERKKLQEHLESQQEEEDEVQEENDSDDDDDDKDDNIRTSMPSTIPNNETSSNEQIHSHWGENLSKRSSKVKNKNKNKKLLNKKISNEEVQLLRQEFVTHMYESFLDGKDGDFDYRYTN